MEIKIKDIKKKVRKTVPPVKKQLITFNYYLFALLDALTDTDGDNYNELFFPTFVAAYELIKAKKDADPVEIFNKCYLAAYDLYLGGADTEEDLINACFGLGACTEPNLKDSFGSRLTLLFFIAVHLGIKFVFQPKL